MHPLAPRTTTVLAADAANYSRAMSLNEERALTALAASRAIIDALISARGGRIFSTAGDSVLAEFSSADEGVRCGVDIQRALAVEREKGGEVLPYRMGVHIGHVYPNGTDLLGETVNIAARLESIANPGGICISDRVQAALADTVELRIEAIGSRILKGILEPVGVSRIRLGEPDHSAENPSAVTVAILPFRSSAEDRYWGEGLAEDLIAALSRFSSIAVFSRDSTFSFDPEVDPRRVSIDLGVRFVVSGSVAVRNSQFRLLIRLLESSSGAVAWAERYSYRAKEVLDVQDQLVEKIVATLAGRLEHRSAETVLRKRPENLGAFDLLLKGRHYADKLDLQSARSAVSCFERALALEPDYAEAMAMLALMRLRVWALHPGSGDLDDVAKIAERALSLDPADSWCHLVAGQIDMYRRRLDVAEVRHKKAYALNPCDARILALWSPLATYLGKPDEGRNRIERAMILNPLHPAWYETNLGLACYCSGAYDKGAAVYSGVAAPQIGVLAGLVACRAQLEDKEGIAEARSALLRIAPDFGARRFVDMRPFKFASDRDHLFDGLRKGGLPA
jgi:adenylate cyclase